MSKIPVRPCTSIGPARRPVLPIICCVGSALFMMYGLDGTPSLTVDGRMRLVESGEPAPMGILGCRGYRWIIFPGAGANSEVRKQGLSAWPACSTVVSSPLSQACRHGNVSLSLARRCPPGTPPTNIPKYNSFVHNGRSFISHGWDPFVG